MCTLYLPSSVADRTGLTGVKSCCCQCCMRNVHTCLHCMAPPCVCRTVSTATRHNEWISGSRAHSEWIDPRITFLGNSEQCFSIYFNACAPYKNAMLLSLSLSPPSISLAFQLMGTQCFSFSLSHTRIEEPRGHQVQSFHIRLCF